MCVQDLCIRQAQILHTWSSLVEEAANEVINMLLEFENSQREEEKEEEERCGEGEGKLTFSSGPLSSRYDNLQLEEQ